MHATFEACAPSPDISCSTGTWAQGPSPRNNFCAFVCLNMYFSTSSPACSSSGVSICTFVMVKPVKLSKAGVKQLSKAAGVKQELSKTAYRMHVAVIRPRRRGNVKDVVALNGRICIRISSLRTRSMCISSLMTRY